MEWKNATQNVLYTEIANREDKITFIFSAFAMQDTGIQNFSVMASENMYINIRVTEMYNEIESMYWMLVNYSMNAW